MTQQQESPPDTGGPEDGVSASAADRSYGTDWLVFGLGGALAVVFVLWGVLGTESLSSAASTLQSGLIEGGGWAFILAATGFVVFSLYLAFSRFGKIRLGTDAEQPEFRTVSWIAMMFSAGMGIGLMFFGVAEPIAHYGAPPLGLVEAQTPEAAALSLQYTYFHWTLTPWAIYGMVGLAIAYSTMRKNRPNLISATLTPILGDRVNGPLGQSIDVLAIWATLFGTATSWGTAPRR